MRTGESVMRDLNAVNTHTHTGWSSSSVAVAAEFGSQRQRPHGNVSKENQSPQGRRGFPARVCRQEAEKGLGYKMWHLFDVHALPR